MSDLSFDTARATGLVAPRQSWWANALLSSVRVGRLTLVTPSGVRLTHTPTAPGPEGTMVLHRWRTLRRLLAGGDVAEALGRAASSIFAVLQATHEMGERELQLVAAQERLVAPPRRFTAERL